MKLLLSVLFSCTETEEPTLVHAMKFHHAEPLSAPSTLLIQDEDAKERLHLLLFFPDGQGWDAEGWVTGRVHSRGGTRGSASAYSPKQHYTAVILHQGRVTMEADWNEQSAISPSKNSIPRLNTKRSFRRVTLEQGRIQLDAEARQSLHRGCRFCVKKPIEEKQKYSQILGD